MGLSNQARVRLPFAILSQKILSNLPKKKEKGDRMLNLDNLFFKYLNSENNWILAMPVAEDGYIKLRCYMTSKKEQIASFQRCYTYIVDFELLAQFYAYKSVGQAYNQLIRFRKKRVGFLEESDKIEGFFTIQDIIRTAQQGRSELVLEQVDKYMKMQKLVFSTKKPSKKEKQKCKAQYDEIKSALQGI